MSSVFTYAGRVFRLAIGIVFYSGMEGFCSFSAITGGKCGFSRGNTECIALNSCDGDIGLHLANHHLSRENVRERDLILARAGLLELSEQIKNMTVCPAHRFSLGKYWQAPKTCQYPRHQGKKTVVTGTHVINFKLAREIKNIFGDATLVGSRKCYIHNSRSLHVKLQGCEYVFNDKAISYIKSAFCGRAYDNFYDQACVK